MGRNLSIIHWTLKSNEKNRLMTIVIFDTVVNRFAKTVNVTIDSAIKLLDNKSVQEYFEAEAVICSQSRKKIIMNLISLTLCRDKEDLDNGVFFDSITKEEIAMYDEDFSIEIKEGYDGQSLVEFIKYANSFSQCFKHLKANYAKIDSIVAANLKVYRCLYDFIRTPINLVGDNRVCLVRDMTMRLTRCIVSNCTQKMDIYATPQSSISKNTKKTILEYLDLLTSVANDMSNILGDDLEKRLEVRMELDKTVKALSAGKTKLESFPYKKTKLWGPALKKIRAFMESVIGELIRVSLANRIKEENKKKTKHQLS